MTREQAKARLAVITAFANGATVQIRNGIHPNWTECLNPSFSGDDQEFRIKPTPTIRPWRPEEVPVGEVVRSKESGGRFLLAGVYKGGDLIIGSNLYPPKEVLNKFEMDEDGSPCGVMEDGNESLP